VYGSWGDNTGASRIAIGALPIAIVLAVITGCGGRGSDEGSVPSYDSGNVTASWVDATRAQSNALVAHDGIVCSTRAQELYCLDATNGDEIFAEQLPGTATSPALAGETLVVGVDSGPGGVLYGYSLEGRQLWSRQLDGHDVQPWQLPAGAPLVAAGDVVAWVRGTTRPQDLVAVDVASGQVQWRVPAADLLAVYADGRQIYTTNEHGSLVALDPTSGAELWRAQIDATAGGGRVASLTPVVDGAAVAVTIVGEPSRVVVVDAATGAQRWEQVLEAAEAIDASVAGTNGVIYVNDDDFLTAFDQTGDDLWSAPAAGGRLGPSDPLRLVAEHGRLFTIGEDVWDVSTNGGGGKRMREDVNAADVAVVNDHVIIAGATRLEAVPLVER